KAARLGTRMGSEGAAIKILTPLIRLDKAGIVRLARRLGVPVERTWSCYSGGKTPCLRCDSCKLRQKGLSQVRA
ncbi:MAG: 7-cyano-7-deazaguanine synthase, partial [Elusimicrobiota bacterium]